MREKYFKNEAIEMWIENGILHAIYASPVEISEQMAHELIKARHSLTQGYTYPLFADVSKATTMSKEARKVFSSPESERGLSSGAFLVRTQIEVFIIRAWLAFSPSKLPTQFFTEKEKALQWLEQFKRIN